MDNLYIAFNPNELEHTNAHLIHQGKLGEWLKDLDVGFEIYEAKLKYTITEKYKRTITKASGGEHGR